MDDIFRNYKSYNFDSIDEINEEAGLYAWYGICNFGRGDWDSKDVLISSIDSEMKKFRTSKFDALIKSSFGLKWETSLPEIVTDRWIKNAENSISRDEKAVGVEDLEDVLSTERNRAILGRVLNSAYPFFNVPIYVGMAGNLSKIIKKQKEQLDELFEKKFDPKERMTLFDKGNDFAERVLGAGFYANQLFVCTIELGSLLEEDEINTISELELAKIAKLAEYFFNRRVKPSLGRI